jgi:S1-C subfamily serine protease
MSAYPTLRAWSDQRARLVADALARASVVVLGRRNCLCGIRWRDDLIVTAAEAIGGAERAGVRFEGDEIGAEVIAVDPGTDVAVLRIAPAPPAASASTASASAGSAPAGGGAKADIRVGDAIALIGRTLRGPSATWGSVKLVGPAWNSRRGGKIDQRLELDVRFDEPQEGAAVIDMDGNLVAMAVPGPYRRVLGIPAETIESVVAKVEKYGHLPRPYIGVRLQSLWLDDETRVQLGRHGRSIAAVGGIDAGSPAAEAQVALGDLLLSLDGEPADGVTALAQRIASVNPGQTISLEVLRGGKPMEIRIQVGERPRH